MTVAIEYDEALIEEISARFTLRDPNRRALAAVVQALVAAGGKYTELVADLATGVGKTFLMAALVDYLAAQGFRNILVVTPNTTIQTKTISNFTVASPKHVAGAEATPNLITPDTFQNASTSTLLRDQTRLKVLVFNIQQLLPPSQKAASTNPARRVRREDENLGEGLYQHLQKTDDLVVIADEHHVYREKAPAFFAAVRDLSPFALVGLTATPEPADSGKIVFQYTLGEAIADKFVKVPVIVYRDDGMTDERTQLRDACTLLRRKAAAYAAYRAATPKASSVNPVLFVVCSDIDHATEVGQILAGPGFIGHPDAVLEITSQSSDAALTALAEVEDPDSAIRAIVSVNKLREGWDVRNIAVIVALRRLASQSLTEQILGRGLRLPFGVRTGIPMVDQVDLVAHDSYRELLAQRDILRQRIQQPASQVPVDDQGFGKVDPQTAAAVAAATNDGAQADPSGGSEVPTSTPDANQLTLFSDDSNASPMLGFETVADATKPKVPEPKPRVAGAPQILFPLEEYVLAPSPFMLSDVSNSEAREAGSRFVNALDTVIFRKALESTRTDGSEVRITVEIQDTETAEQTMFPLDVVDERMVAAVMALPEVTAERRERRGAKRIVEHFLAGAGATSDSAAVEWSSTRQAVALQGLQQLIRRVIANRPRHQQTRLKAVTLPIEPVLVSPDAPRAHEDDYIRHVDFTGWRKSVMPIAKFDAASTEWAIAHILEASNEIKWWLRLYTNGDAYIPSDVGRYFPDFVALDAKGTYWVIEGKADDDAKDAKVLTKKAAAERWARFVRDDGDHGTWRYLFVTESHIRAASMTWTGLLTAANPE